eukprot:scaffold27425_cov69-Phaeocystis_antarctica.AAC.9
MVVLTRQAACRFAVWLELPGRAQLACARTNGAACRTWAAWRLLRAARRRKVAHAGLGALTGAGEAGGAGVCALHTRQRRAGTLGAVRTGLTRQAACRVVVWLELPGCAHSSHAPTPTALLDVPIEQGRQEPELLAPLEHGGGARTHLLAVATRSAVLAGRAALARREGAWCARGALEGSSLVLERPTAHAGKTCRCECRWDAEQITCSSEITHLSHSRQPPAVSQPTPQPVRISRRAAVEPPRPHVPSTHGSGQPVKLPSATRMLAPETPGFHPGIQSPKVQLDTRAVDAVVRNTVDPAVETNVLSMAVNVPAELMLAPCAREDVETHYSFHQWSNRRNVLDGLKGEHT